MPLSGRLAAMTKAGLAICICEGISIGMLFCKHFGSFVDISIEEFLSRAPLTDIIIFQIRQRNLFVGLCLLTMGRLFP